METGRSEAFRLLGIPAGSDRESVARAYHRLARLTHPDVSANPEAARRFADLTAAYRLACERPGLDAEPAPVVRSEGQTPAPAQSESPGDPPASGGVWVLDPDSTVPRPPGVPGWWARPDIVAGPVRVRPPRGDGSKEVRDG